MIMLDAKAAQRPLLRQLTSKIPGLTPALVGAGVAWGVYFYAYNAAKNRYKKHLKMDLGEKLPPWLHLASAAEAGSIVRKSFCLWRGARYGFYCSSSVFLFFVYTGVPCD